MSKPSMVEGDDQPNAKNNEDIVIGDVFWICGIQRLRTNECKLVVEVARMDNEFLYLVFLDLLITLSFSHHWYLIFMHN